MSPPCWFAVDRASIVFSFSFGWKFFEHLRRCGLDISSRSQLTWVSRSLGTSVMIAACVFCPPASRTRGGQNIRNPLDPGGGKEDMAPLTWPNETLPSVLLQAVCSQWKTGETLIQREETWSVEGLVKSESDVLIDASLKHKGWKQCLNPHWTRSIWSVSPLS